MRHGLRRRRKNSCKVHTGGVGGGPNSSGGEKKKERKRERCNRRLCNSCPSAILTTPSSLSHPLVVYETRERRRSESGLTGEMRPVPLVHLFYLSDLCTSLLQSGGSFFTFRQLNQPPPNSLGLFDKLPNKEFYFERITPYTASLVHIDLFR